MPWKACSMSQRRLALVHQIVAAHRPVSVVAREYGVSRKTAYKWVARYRLDQDKPLSDQSRRPVDRSGAGNYLLLRSGVADGWLCNLLRQRFMLRHHFIPARCTVVPCGTPSTTSAKTTPTA